MCMNCKPLVYFFTNVIPSSGISKYSIRLVPLPSLLRLTSWLTVPNGILNNLA